MKPWYKIKEQSASKGRLLFLWYVYKIFGLKMLKLALKPIVAVISLFAENAVQASREYLKILNDYQKEQSLPLSRFSAYQHILSYASAMADKMSALCDEKCKLQYVVDNNSDFQSFQKILNEKKGAFLICSHLGNIEALCGIKNENHVKLNALMEVSQNSIFYQFIKERSVNQCVRIYPSESFDFGTIMELYENLEKGELLMMAGDRVSAENPNAVIKAKLLNKTCLLPKGVFEFALKMKKPCFAITLTKTQKSAYELSLKQLDTTQNINQIAEKYIKFLEQKILEDPLEWYNFYTYFFD